MGEETTVTSQGRSHSSNFIQKILWGRVSRGFPGLGYQKLLLGAIADVGLIDHHQWSNAGMVEKIGDPR
ncbi:hypothetical protein J0895_04035 [Phormidium pseudopriestleyi FRX01]|uniref:Uncharacterized protein n=1 Tax=Phormidium pseudopriestleyi FRX01 TaxID=1759528 RepID=A0ABS3FMG1_9CYAN|nr:hypothetical protein [Phormidium pseudopriestleyi]MBO0348285.1 hypothetical protein [Phormidium pseudopriestleyi FRX01]